MKLLQFGYTICLAAAISACAVGPDFKPAAAPASDHYTAQPLPSQTAATAVTGGESQSFIIGQQLPSRWWTTFNCPRLDGLVDQSFNGSPTVSAAAAALRQASETLRAQRSGLFPAFDGSANASRQKTAVGATGQNGTNGQTGGSIYNLYDASVSVSYTLDVFGGVRRGIEQQSAAVDYQRYELAGTYQTLAANVVTAAIQEASLRAQATAYSEIIANYENGLKITERQYQLGGASNANVLLERSNLASARAALPPIKQQLALTQHRLAVYLGKPTSDVDASNFDLSELTLPQQLPVSLPSELVRQRPDVLQAEALLHEASAKVGIATANMLPQIRLTADYGVQSTKTSTLFDGNIWSIGAGITQPLFHFGQLSAERRAAIAAYDQAAAQYQLSVLQAFQNVADSLRAIQYDADSLQAQTDAQSSSEQSLHLTEKQYAAGGVSYLDLLTAQRQYQQVRVAYIQALAARYQDTAALFQALGGGTDGTPATVASR